MSWTNHENSLSSSVELRVKYGAGTYSDVEDLSWVIKRIEADERHTGFSILDDIAIAERACPDWAMKHIHLAKNVPDRKDALERELPEKLDVNLRRIFLNFAALN